MSDSKQVNEADLGWYAERDQPITDAIKQDLDVMRSAMQDIGGDVRPVEAPAPAQPTAGINIAAHPLIRQSYEVSLAIEECAASEQQTNAAIKSSALTTALSNMFADDNYVAFLRWAGDTQHRHLVLCNSDDERAFKVYRAPQSAQPVASPTAEEIAETEPYRVEPVSGGCEHCGSGHLWTVVWKDAKGEENETGQSWGDKQDAEDVCEYMNTAYQFALSKLEARHGEAEKYLHLG